MKRLLLISALLFGLSAALPASAAPSDVVTTPTGDILPDQHFTTMDGKDISLSQFKGKTILVHYWGTWCPPCVEELPNLLGAVKDNPRAVVIAITVEHDKETVTNFLNRIQMPNPGDNVHFVLDPNSSIVVGGKRTMRFPTTVIISPNGAVADRVNGGIDWHGYSF